MIEPKLILREYTTLDDISLFAKWFNKLKHMEAMKVTHALYQLERGNFSNVKSVNDGVYEFKIDYGPGYRIYFGQDGTNIIILLYGGSKKKQDRDIGYAKELWKNYKQRKKLLKEVAQCH